MTGCFQAGAAGQPRPAIKPPFHQNKRNTGTHQGEGLEITINTLELHEALQSRVRVEADMLLNVPAHRISTTDKLGKREGKKKEIALIVSSATKDLPSGASAAAQLLQVQNWGAATIYTFSGQSTLSWMPHQGWLKNRKIS